MKKVLIKDIAKEMGLSRNTVAKALKNDSSVLEETRKRVVNTAYKMGYSKLSEDVMKYIEKEKESLGSKKSKSYAVVMGEASSDFWEGIIVGIQDEINRNHGSCVAYFIKEEDERNLMLPSNLTPAETEGIICLTVFSEAYTKKIMDLGIPMVFLDSPIRKLPYNYTHDIVMIEGKQSIYEITTDLINQGCKSLGFIGDITYCQSIYDRWLGFKEAMEGRNIKIDSKFCLTGYTKYHYYVRDELESKLDELDKVPDAFVCANDDIAIVVIQYYKKKGYRIPEDLAVTGFDNRKTGLIIEPHLTTVDPTKRRLGRRLVTQLLWRIQNPTMRNEIITVTTKVYYRESSRKYTP